MCRRLYIEAEYNYSEDEWKGILWTEEGEVCAPLASVVLSNPHNLIKFLLGDLQAKYEKLQKIQSILEIMRNR